MNVNKKNMFVKLKYEKQRKMSKEYMNIYNHKIACILCDNK